MEIRVRKLTTKTQALVHSVNLFHETNKYKFIKDEAATTDSLNIKNEQPIHGWTAIFSYLLNLKINSAEFGDFFFVCNQLKSGKRQLSEQALVKLNDILSTREFISGESLGELDVIAYTRIRAFGKDLPFSLLRFSALHQWYLTASTKIDAIIPFFEKSITVLAVKEKKAPKKPENKPEQQQQGEKKADNKKADAPKKQQQEKPEAAGKKAEKTDAPQKAEKPEKPAKAEKKEKKEKPAPVEAPKKVFAAKPDTVDPAYKAAVNNQRFVRSNKGQPVLPVDGERNILITSALPYVNNAPHLGTLIGCVLSGDVFARYCRSRGYNTIYVCGTDEYGTATEMKALQEKTTPAEICTKYYKIQKDVYDWFDIDFDIFGRTTTEKHTKISQDIFLTLHKNGYIKEDVMHQSFCASCDKFLADRYVNGTCPFCGHDDCHGDQCDKCGKLVNPAELITPKCTICKNPSVIKETKHCFLDLPQLESEIDSFIDKRSQEGGWSENAYKTSKAWIKNGLKYRCITRDLKWGTPIPLPGWENKVMYVWFDAPIGYPSITANLVEDWEKWWKNPDNVKLYQFIGKDNIPFHCVIFPGTLLGTRDNWTFLHSMSSCEYLQYESGKFSKSKSVGVFGDDAQKTGIPVEVWRYYLLINRPEQNDTNFQWADFAAKNNNELLPNIGNLLQRILKFTYSKFDKKVPAVDLSLLNEEDKAWLNSIQKLFQEYLNHMEKVEIKSALKVVMQISSEGNNYMQKNEPWNKANQETGRHVVALFVLINVIRFLSALFEPFMPTLSAKINFMLGLETRTPKDEKILEFISSQPDAISAILNLVPSGQVINEPIPIFRKLEDEEIENFKLQFSGGKKL